MFNNQEVTFKLPLKKSYSAEKWITLFLFEFWGTKDKIKIEMLFLFKLIKITSIYKHFFKKTNKRKDMIFKEGISVVLLHSSVKWISKNEE